MNPASFRNFTVLYSGPFLAISLLVLGCDLFDPMENHVVIIVGSRQVVKEELKGDMEFISAGLGLPDQDRDRIRDKLIEKLIDHYLILEYGREKGISVSDKEFEIALEEIKKGYGEDDFRDALSRAYGDLEQWKHRLKEQLCVKKILRKVAEGIASPSEEEIKQYFEQKPDSFKSPQMIRFRQIVTRTEKEAKSLHARLHKGEDMAELAKKYSIAPEADNGGIVDWVARDHLDESMEKTLFSLKEGKISPVTKTAYGYHVFKVLSLRPEGVRTLPEVKREIEAQLLRQKREAFYGKWLKGLRTHYRIRINEELLKTI